MKKAPSLRETRTSVKTRILALWVVVLLASCASTPPPVVPPTVANDPSLPSISIDGYEYHAETYGDPSSPVVITLHGGPGGDYRSILSLRALSDEYFVVFFDQRGAGLSPRVDPATITFDTVVEDLDSVVEHFGRGRTVSIVGHSWGAQLASAYAGRYPDKVDHIVLAEPGFLTPDFAKVWMQETRLRWSFPVLRYFLQTRRAARRVNGPDGHESDDFFGHEINMYEGDDHPQAGYRCDGVMPSETPSWRYGAAASDALFASAVDADGNIVVSFVDGVDSIAFPVLFMAGECSTVIGTEWQRSQMELFPQAELAVISGAGHEMFSENPDESIAAVRRYLNTPSE